MRTNRALASLAIGAIVGLTVASLVGIPQLVGAWSIPALVSNAFTFWGLFFGGFAAVVTGALVFAVLNRRDRRTSRWGRFIAGLALALLAAATTLWIVMWGFSPFTLEGMWIYPLAVVPGIGAVALLRRRRPGFWGAPPGS